MKRHWVYALAALLALPCTARAQGDPGWGPILRITPVIGVSPGFSQEGVATVFDNNLSAHEYRLEHGSSVLLGLNAEYRAWNRFAVLVGGMWSSRGDGRLIDFEDEIVYDYEGSTLWLMKAGFALRLREVRPDLQLRRLNASVFVAPAMIIDNPKTSVFTPATSRANVTHYAVNMGAEAELPLTNDRLAFQLGFEDWLILWNEDDFGRRFAGYLQQRSPNAAVAIDPDNSHLVVFRAGMSWRF